MQDDKKTLDEIRPNYIKPEIVQNANVSTNSQTSRTILICTGCKAGEAYDDIKIYTENIVITAISKIAPAGEVRHL